MDDSRILDATSIGIPDKEAGEVPMAFIVAAEKALLSEDEVRQIVASKLAGFKQIQRVVFADAVPKLVSGKILRRILRQQIA